MLYGDISSSSWWGDEITPKQFKEDLDALGEIDTLNIFVNSSGGDVFAGQAIRSMLKRHKAKKIGYVDGLAASIASVILTACDTVIMPINAMQMVHRAWTFALGNANDMRKMADDLDKIDESIIAAYQEKTGLDKDKVIELMDAETWLTAEEALEYGFADEIEETKNVAASANGKLLMVNGKQFDLSRFHNVPNGIFMGIKNEGKTLSAANEDRLKQARNLLDEVINQSNTTEDPPNNSAKARAEPAGTEPKDPVPPVVTDPVLDPEPKAHQSLTALYQAKIKNLRRKKNEL